MTTKAREALTKLIGLAEEFSACGWQLGLFKKPGTEGKPPESAWTFVDVCESELADLAREALKEAT